MRKTFLFPIIKQFQRGNLNWLISQTINGIKIKYWNKYLPFKLTTSPVMAVLLMTYHCNSRCLMCSLTSYADETNCPELTTEGWKKIIKELTDIKTAGIGFTGGEPLIRNDIPELIRYARSLGLVTTLNTNALSFPLDNIKKVLTAEPENINISLDGVNPKTYDRLRGVPGGFERMIQNTKQLVSQRNALKKNTTITFVTCVSEHNINEIDKIARLASEIGVDKIGFIPMHYLPNTKVLFGNKTLLTCKSHNNIGPLFIEKIRQIRDENIIKIDNNGEYLKMFPSAFSGGKFPIKCLSGETSITIDCYGNIYACWPFLELHKPFAHIKDNSIKEIWLGKEYEKVRKMTNKCHMCFWNCHAELSLFYQ